MSTDLTRDEQVLLEGLESLFRPDPDVVVPKEFTDTLKRQVHDRLSPERLSAGETMAVTLVAVVILGLTGVHGWSPFGLVASSVAVWLFVRATQWVGTRAPSRE
jgi:hypothetical protein